MTATFPLSWAGGRIFHMFGATPLRPSSVIICTGEKAGVMLSR
jgi:hypothetical protein